MKKIVIFATLLTLIGIIAHSSEVVTRETSTSIIVCSDFGGEIFPKG